jgi:hypothetical protein
MMEVNKNQWKNTATTNYKWADGDFDFISPQNQPKTVHNFSGHTQGKYSSTKNINIPPSIPPPPAKNAQKLAEIANKIKLELPKSSNE